MNEPDASTVLARARLGLSPSEADQARVYRSLLAAASVAAARPASSSLATTTRLARGTARLLVASSLVAAIGGAGYWAGFRAARRQQSAAPIAAPVSPTVVPAPRTTPPLDRARPTTAATNLARGPSLARGPRTEPGHDEGAGAKGARAASLDAEVRALRSVERALRDDEPGMALALLRELDRAVPDGKLVEERDAMLAIARCARGEVPFGIDLARDFGERHPNSVYLERVTQNCAAEPARRGARP
jgi:hypothetical protein